MFTGLMTASDLLMELAGAERPEDSDQMVRRDDGSYLVDGSMPMHDVREVLSLPSLKREDFSTVAGYVLEVLGEFPQVGSQVEVQDWTLEVVDLDGPRIDRILITPPEDMVLMSEALADRP
jgi:putative hemolysin